MVYSYGSQILLDNVIITNNNNNEEYYRCLFEKKPSLIINLKIIIYANKYGKILPDNEYEYLINHNYKISTFCMNPKLHKSKELKEIIKIRTYKYY